MPQAKHAYTTRKYPRALSKSAVTVIEAAVEAHLMAIEALTTCLDSHQPDPDLEPSLASIGSCGWAFDNQEAWTAGNDDDREGDEHDGREPDVEDEPSLAHTNDIDQDRAQKHLASVTHRDGTWHDMYSDLEDEHDGREPSLASLPCVGAIHGYSGAGFSQVNWAAGGLDDRENDGDDREPEDRV